MNQEFWALRWESGAFLAMDTDEASPFETYYPAAVKFFVSKDQALWFSQNFPTVKLEAVQVSLSEVEKLQGQLKHENVNLCID